MLANAELPGRRVARSVRTYIIWTSVRPPRTENAKTAQNRRYRYHTCCVGTMTTMTAIPDGALRRTRQLVFVTMLFVSLVVPASAFFSISSPLMPSIHQSRRSRSHLVVTAASGDDADDTEGGDDSPGSKAAAPVATKPGVNGPVRLSGPSRIDEYKSPVNFEKGVTKGPGPLSPRWSDSGRWEKDQDRKAESGEQSAGEQQFLLKEKYGTYFRVPNPATLMTSKCAPFHCPQRHHSPHHRRQGQGRPHDRHARNAQNAQENLVIH